MAKLIESLSQWESVVHKLAQPYGAGGPRALPDIVGVFLEDYAIAPDLVRSWIVERTTEYARHGLAKAAAAGRANAAQARQEARRAKAARAD